MLLLFQTEEITHNNRNIIYIEFSIASTTKHFINTTLYS